MILACVITAAITTSTKIALTTITIITLITVTIPIININFTIYPIVFTLELFTSFTTPLHPLYLFRPNYYLLRFTSFHLPFWRQRK